MKHNRLPKKADLELAYEKLTKRIKSESLKNKLHKALTQVYQQETETDRRPSAIDIAFSLKHIGVDATTLIATLLSDPRLRKSFDPLAIEQEYGASVANLVNHVHWMNTFKECSDSSNFIPEEAEALRRMLLATVDDVRAVLIRLAFRVQRLRGLKHEPAADRYCIAKETMEIYAPLANRLGIAELKWEMEDLAFRFLEPEQYKSLAKSMDDKRTDREQYIEKFISLVNEKLEKNSINAKVSGRPKHLYSIWKKMFRKQLQLHELADLLAVRVVVESVQHCYLALGIIHSLWQHLPHEFDDYIASSKENGYQSIHTAVIGPENRIVEIQIRTREMHEFSEHGFAAHWRYKEGSKQDQAMEQTLSAVRHLLENREDDSSLLESFKTEFFRHRVMVLTPKKEVIDLPKGATALDFAYAIHTEIGHHCTGALANNHRVPLSYPLKSGEVIKILTDKSSKPCLSWLDHRKDYVTTARSKVSIRNWFRPLFKDSDDNLILSHKNLQGIGNHKAIPAPCCKPQIGDRITGELLNDESIQVHRQNCLSLSRNKAEKQTIELNWGEEAPKQKVTVHIEAFDRQGLLQDITTLLNQSQANVLKAHTETDSIDQSVTMDLTFEKDSLNDLEHLLKRIEYIPNVFRTAIAD